ncbi:R3H domain-containing nucleic acid-binding protein [Actinoplanes oblitus]|uniref:R3H domain-containing nucleic acid-binding protein n=1 Tax=Actinoplanes oblitus TaxID=3040509 RepID=A0ABY8WHM6_9ACTN|nr:R3H domain-containing nucleic acid-binding protein [Actinoplanes oblitus]WIM96558.1 R3H domain-containing nucleic acid-binding protein [Actinoplanes oblitus]
MAAARETADRSRSGPSDNGDETVTDTSTPPASESSAPAADAATSSVEEASTEAKKSETVASDSDLFRQSEIAADYVEGLLDILDYDGDIDELVSAGRPMVEVVGGRLQPLVGQRGATLEALQELTRLAIFRATGSPSRLLLDIGGYRATRRKELGAVARNAVEKVKEHGEAVRLEPMSAFERKCVHDVVNAIPGVQSESEGVEPNRRIVVRVAD